MGFWIYMLRCSDGSYYTGHTDNLETRMNQHSSGAIPGYTLNRKPVTLVFSEELATRVEALKMERQIKGWSRAKKEALIRSDWAEVSRLAKSRALRQAGPEQAGRILRQAQDERPACRRAQGERFE